MPTLHREIWLPRAREVVFAFFADAVNLERLTPAWLKFHVLSEQPIEMREGAKIDYRLRLHGWPVRWQSEITVWDPPARFVDEQRRGPYRQWVHDHTFITMDDGTLVRDDVQYRVLGGWLINRLLVQRDVRKIFDFRHAKLREIFG